MITKRLPKFIAALMSALLLTAASIMSFSAAVEINEHYALTDDAGYFSAEETAELEQELEKAYGITGWQLIIHTSYEGVSADDMDKYYNAMYYDSQSFEENSVMFVIDLASSNRIIIPHGEAMYYFDDDRMSEIKSSLAPYLDNEDFFGASLEFISVTESYFNEGEATGENTNIVENLKADNPLLYSLREYGIVVIPLGLIVGLVIFFVTLYRYKHMGKSGTYNFTENTSVNLTESQDDFISEHTTVRRISTENKHHSSGSSGGGGSTHGSSGSF